MARTAKKAAAKDERIEVRVTPQAKALLMTAAQARHTTVSDFLLRHGIEAAEDVLAMPRVFYATEQGWQTIQEMLAEDEPRPNRKDIEWLLARKIKIDR
jgi:uncharacterized protein (DUF1778 family)